MKAILETMNYKGYEAVVTFDEEDRLFVGRVINTRGIIVFDGRSVDELDAVFRATVDEYLEDCASVGKAPDKPFTGRFNVRIPPELHRALAIKAARLNISLNALVEQTLRETARRAE